MLPTGTVRLCIRSEDFSGMAISVGKEIKRQRACRWSVSGGRGMVFYGNTDVIGW